MRNGKVSGVHRTKRCTRPFSHTPGWLTIGRGSEQLMTCQLAKMLTIRLTMSINQMKKNWKMSLPLRKRVACEGCHTIAVFRTRADWTSSREVERHNQEENPDHTFSVAPCEGNKPVPLLSEESLEELCHPHLFPLGRGGFNQERNQRLTLKRYVNQRLLNLDGRFAKDINYILGMQFATDHALVRSSARIALRQASQSQFKGGMTAGALRANRAVANMIKKDAAYRFLQQVRGSPPYWQKMFYELLAMVKGLGISTFFFTLSSADLQWPEVLQTIAAQYGEKYTCEEVKELPWKKRTELLRMNPVTAARMFQHRVEAFMTVFLKHKAKPMGEVTDFVHRVEFQARGSPHIHGMLWIKGAPKLGIQSDEEVIQFIDKYISCCLPDDDEELLELVRMLQTHSHSATCRRGDKCRFNFPKPPSNCTMLTSEPEGEHAKEELAHAVETLAAVREVLRKADEASLAGRHAW